MTAGHRLTASAVVTALTAAGLVGLAAPAGAAPALTAPASAAATNVMPATAGPVGTTVPTAGRSSQPGTLRLQTVPPLAGVVVTVDGRTARSNKSGLVTVSVNNFIGLQRRIAVPETHITPDRSVLFDRYRGDPDSAVGGKVIQLGLRTRRLVTWRFVDRFGGEVEVDKVRSMRIRSNTGEIAQLTGAALARPRWVPESRTQQGPNGLVSKKLYWVVDSADVGGASVVNKAQQRFTPWEQQSWLVQLLFYKVVLTASDLFFTMRVGDGIELTRPDGHTERLAFNSSGKVSVSDLPRGTYMIRAYGGGVSFARPVSISKDQEVSLDVISRIDLGLVSGTLLVLAVSLILLGRPHLRPSWPRRWRRSGADRPAGRDGPAGDGPAGDGPSGRGDPASPSMRRPRDAGGTPRQRRRRLVRAGTGGGAAMALLIAAVAFGAVAQPQPAHAQEPTNPVPVFAYYYIWFNPTSWNRAKIDYPLLGRYSSDDVEIMRRHVKMAKAAGINGFLVSWKHTPQLDERLAKLTTVARTEGFHLGIVYQGLDFNREPLPLPTVRQDLALFAERYGRDPVYNVFGKPVVVWTGSTRHDRAEVDATVRDVRKDLLVLGDAKTVEDCEALTPVLDGQAYYWSSVDPTRGTSRARLVNMSRAVHRGGGLWFAPVSPGFDARLVGGSKTVPRRNGETLRASFDATVSTDPDAIGVISWNEFSENTHLEPSERYGTTDLNVLSDLLGAGKDITAPVDSSEATDGQSGLTSWGALALLAATAGLLPLTIAISRRRRAATAADRLAYEVENLPREGRS